MRQQWFTHVRLPVAHLTRSRRAFPATLTTTALDRRSIRWFGLPACTASPEGQTSITGTAQVCAGDLLHHHHAPFMDTRPVGTATARPSCVVEPEYREGLFGS